MRFLFVTTLSPPLKSVEEVRGRKPQLSSQFRSVSCLHPRCLPLPSTQTSSSILCNFKNKVTQISTEESKKERKGKERKGRPSSSPPSLSAYAHNAMGTSRQSGGRMSRVRPIEWQSPQHLRHTNACRHRLKQTEKHIIDSNISLIHPTLLDRSC